MNYALLTRRFIFFAAVAIGLYDLFAAAFAGPGSTISLQMWQMVGANEVSFREKSLIFALAYLAGHVLGRIDSASARS